MADRLGRWLRRQAWLQGVPWLQLKPQGCAPIALIWWGSWPRGATLGDLLAVDNLSAALTRAGIEHSVLSHPSHAGPAHRSTPDPSALAPQLSTLVFVCGPLVQTKRMRRLLAASGHTRKLAAGVSLLQSQQVFNRQLDGVVARDGVAVPETPGPGEGVKPGRFDLAISHCKPPLERSRPASLAEARIGLCLRGRQKDYGLGRDRSTAVEALFTEVLERQPGRVEPIDTVLSATNPRERIEAQFAAVDLVLTTRLHGSLLGLAAGVPVIAVDQIASGGKLTEVLGRINWPLLFAAEGLMPDSLLALMQRCIEACPLEAIAASQARMLVLSRQAVEASVALIKEQVRNDRS